MNTTRLSAVKVLNIGSHKWILVDYIWPMHIYNNLWIFCNMTSSHFYSITDKTWSDKEHDMKQFLAYETIYAFW